MIITRTPFRMSFFGGGTDFAGFYEHHGGSVISTTFDKYCYISTRHLPRFFDYENQFAYSKIETASRLEDIEHPLIRNAMRFLDMREIRLAYDADLPARSGLGTSSSFAVGMLHAFHVLKGESVSKRQLADEAIYVERTLCGEAGGVQDQIAAAFGGFNRIDFGPSGYTVSPLIMGQARKRELNERLLLFFTGISRYSFQIQESMKRAVEDKEKNLLEMLSLVDEAEGVLTSQKPLSEFGRLLDYTWRLKRGMTDVISNSSIDGLYRKALGAGALGGKLLGAGGGGFLLLYAEPDRRGAVMEAMKDLVHIPFRFETEGTRVIYYEHESWDQVAHKQ